MLVPDLYTYSPASLSFGVGHMAETGPSSLMLVSDHTVVPSRTQRERLNFQTPPYAHLERSADSDRLNRQSLMQGLENAGFNMCRCWKGAKLGYESLFCSFERIGSLGPLFRSNSLLACSLVHIHAYVLVYSQFTFAAQQEVSLVCFLLTLFPAAM